MDKYHCILANLMDIIGSVTCCWRWSTIICKEIEKRKGQRSLLIYIYIYVCMYNCMYICTYACMYLFIHLFCVIIIMIL